MTTLNVIARNPGHYADKHRRVGESFPLADRADFAANWMEAVGWDPKATAEPKAEPAPEPDAEPAPEATAEPKAAKTRPAKPTET